MLKIAFINPSVAIYPPLGLAYISSYAKEHIKDLSFKLFESEKDNEIITNIRKFNPDIIGITSSSVYFNRIKKLAEKIKKEFNKSIIYGGPHITSYPESIPSYVDVGIIGEGEKVFTELASIFLQNGYFSREKLKNIKSIVYRDKNNKIIVNKTECSFVDIDKIPKPDRSIFDTQRYLTPTEILTDGQIIRGTTLLTSRGCPYKCSFCQVTAVWGNPRYHSAERVIEEIIDLYENHKVEGINIIDDLFVANLPRLERIVESLEETGLNKKIKFIVNGRANLINDRLLNLLKRMNTQVVALGLESMDEDILKSLKNGVNVSQNAQAVKMLNEYSFKISGLFMIGSPNETEKQMYKTYNFIKENEKAWGHVHICMTTPLPGTKLWEEALGAGKIKVDDQIWDKLNPQLDDPSIDMKTYIGDIPKDDFLKIAKEFVLLKDNINNKNSSLSGIHRVLTIKNLIRAVKEPKKVISFVCRTANKILLKAGNN